MKRLLLLLTLCATPALPETFFVDNACGTNGNGTTNTCTGGANDVWNSLERIDCTAVGANDIIEVNGGTYYERWAPEAGCVGTAGNPLIVQNVAGEAVIIDGTNDYKGQTWVSRGHNDYECTAGCSTARPAWIGWYENGNGEIQVTYKANDPTVNACGSATALSTNEMFWNQATRRPCVDLGGTNPSVISNYLRFPKQSSAITLFNGGVDHVTIRRHPSGGSFMTRRQRVNGISMTPSSDGITLDGLDIGWVQGRCINTTDNGMNPTANTIIFQNLTVHHCGQEGIRFDDTTGTGSVVKDNVVHSIQIPSIFPACAGGTCQGLAGDNGTGIRVSKSANVIISGNVVYNIGGGKDNLNRSYGIDLESDSVVTPLIGCQDCIVENNYVYDMDHGTPSSQNGNAIHFGAGSGGTYDGTIIRNNRMWDVDVCIVMDGVTYPTGTLQIVNNTCLDPLVYGFEKQDGTYSLTVNLRNNIWAAPSTTPTLLVKVTGSNIEGFQTPDYNSYYCPSCTDIIDWKGTTYRRNGLCTTDCVADLDANSVYGNPGISTLGMPPTMNIMFTSGSAYANGVNLGATVPNDYLGLARPAGGAYDIGAHEFPANGEPPGPVPVAPENLRRVDVRGAGH